MKTRDISINTSPADCSYQCSGDDNKNIFYAVRKLNDDNYRCACIGRDLSLILGGGFTPSASRSVPCTLEYNKTLTDSLDADFYLNSFLTEYYTGIEKYRVYIPPPYSHFLPGLAKTPFPWHLSIVLCVILNNIPP